MNKQQLMVGESKELIQNQKIPTTLQKEQDLIAMRRLENLEKAHEALRLKRQLKQNMQTSMTPGIGSEILTQNIPLKKRKERDFTIEDIIDVTEFMRDKQDQREPKKSRQNSEDQHSTTLPREERTWINSVGFVILTFIGSIALKFLARTMVERVSAIHNENIDSSNDNYNRSGSTRQEKMDHLYNGQSILH